MAAVFKMFRKQHTLQLNWHVLTALFISAFCILDVPVLEGQKTSFESDDVCLSKACYDTVDAIKQNRKPGAKPCDDFYKFVCGGWQARNPIPPQQTRWNQFMVLHNVTNHRVKEILDMEDKNDDLLSLKTARKFYRSCRVTHDHADENMQEFSTQLSRWGGWPIITDDWQEEQFNWQKLLVNLERSTFDFSPLLALNMEPNRRDSSKRVISIDHGTLPFCPYVYLETHQEHFGKLVIATAFEFAKINQLPLELEQLLEDTANILNVTVQICALHKSGRKAQSDFRFYNPETIKQLQESTDALNTTTPHSKINWLKLINDYFEGSNVRVNAEETVIVKDIDFILQVIALLDNIQQRDIANYMLFHKITNKQKYLSRKLQQFTNEFDMNTSGQTQDTGVWWQDCVQATMDIFDHAIGYEYVKIYFDEICKEKTTELVHLILDSFVEDLKNNDWMDEETREKAIEKAKNILPVVGYPEWYKNISRVDEIFAEIRIKEKPFFENLENAALGEVLYNAKVLRTTLHPSEFAMGPADINAGYLDTLNVMSIPAGLFQPPFYVPGRPEALNYGAMGSIIGHELSHAFDVQGRLGDKRGNLVNWWSSNTLERYLKHEKCFEKQYNDYLVPELNGQHEVAHLDGEATISENMADNGGLQVAYQAYKKYVGHHGNERRLTGLSNYTFDQLFFIGYATIWCENSDDKYVIQDILSDDHSPNKYRVLIPVSNFEGFSEAWSCPVESKLNPTKKCHFW